MVEFFGDVPEAPARAGTVLPSTVLGNDMDVEKFEVNNEPAYLNAPKGTSFWAKKNQNEREKHPKAYLDYLCCSDVNLNRKRRYREIKGGVKALKDINWEFSVLLGNSQRLSQIII
jgi:hypothetical protein